MVFVLTAIMIPTIGIRATSLEFETHSVHVGGGDCWTLLQCSLLSTICVVPRDSLELL